VLLLPSALSPAALTTGWSWRTGGESSDCDGNGLRVGITMLSVCARVAELARGAPGDSRTRKRSWSAAPSAAAEEAEEYAAAAAAAAAPVAAFTGAKLEPTG
jgi:hypothetical protein